MRFVFSIFFSGFLVSCFSFVRGEVAIEKLSSQARQKASQVAEFAYIQKTAEEIGVKVYLFGGSAAAYAHYVRWYIELQNGAEKHQPERFDFDYTNIYRGNQDLDLVVDGTTEQAREFRSLLRKKYIHVIGDKRDWEVRLLRAPMGDKLPLLDNPDFKNQHTDTNSTGMLDLTASDDEPVFRDLLDWENEDSQFLKDVASARITYLFNDKHETTSRFRDHKNPPIFSAVRYLAKLTQYEVEGRPEDLETIRKIIQDTNFNHLSSYVQQKLEEFALKALLNSPDSEYAWNLLEDLDLRKKLIQMDGNRIDVQHSLSWWLNKEPLRSKELGTKGRTALEIFGKDALIVSHETNSFQAYENITRSSRGAANAFISRKKVSGESAVYGDGFYTRRGLEGARGTGLTIRFKLHPDAKENEDFIFEDDYVVVKNKKALTLIQENINLLPIDFLALFAKGDIGKNDLGLQEKLFQKFTRIPSNHPDYEGVIPYVKSLFINDALPKEYQFPFHEYDLHDFHSVFKIITRERDEYFENTLKEALSDKDITSYWLKSRDSLEFIINSGHKESIELLIENVLSQPGAIAYPDLVKKIIQIPGEDHLDSVVSYILKQKIWTKHIELVELVMEKNENDGFLTSILVHHLFSETHWGEYPNLMYKLIDTVNENELSLIANSFSFSTHWAKYPDLLSTLIQKKTAVNSIIKSALKAPPYAGQIEFLWEIREITKEYDELIVRELLTLVEWKNAHEVLEKIISKRGGVELDSIAKYVFTKPHWGNHPELVLLFIKKAANYRNREHFLRLIIEMMSHSHWKDHPEILLAVAKLKDSYLDEEIVQLLLFAPGWEEYPEILMTIIENKTLDIPLFKQLLKEEHWKENPELKAYVRGKEVNYKNLAEVKTPFMRWKKKQMKKQYSCQILLRD